jgi:8-oxo-dGTP diphosphatase/2-hydroxy-dATP diphosphatase
METKVMTLVIIHQGDKVLLGMKKRGFGAGRWNGFGGKLIDGETIEQATKRETFEEANISLGDLEKVGLINFYWKNKPDFVLEVNIFKSKIFGGIPTESEEMKPQWFDIKEIPYNEMWQDDVYWLPMFLKDKKFKGKFIFDESDNILEKELNELNEI